MDDDAGSLPMPKRERYFHPFDVTYGEVSRLARQLLETLSSQDEKRWLRDIIWNFQVQADGWDANPDLRPYRKLVEDQPLKIMQLAASAYLHIAYDLPRVLADNWPGSSPYDPPGLAKGHQIYDAIGRFFPDVIDDVRIMPEVVGVSGAALNWKAARRVMRLWVVDLRRGAWMHAQMLSGMPPAQRRQVEQAMLASITTALSNVQARVPWSMLDMLPPEDAFNGHGPVIYLAATPILPYDLVSSDLVIPLQIASILISLAILGITFTHLVKSLRKKKTKGKKYRTRMDEELFSAHKLDEMVAEAIGSFGAEIQSEFDRIFSDLRFD